MRANRVAIPESVGGYPVNYGFVPQTVCTTATRSMR